MGYHWHDLTDAQRASMAAFTHNHIAKLSDAQIEALPTLEEGHTSDYKIVTKTRIACVMRVDREDGYYGPKVIHEKLVAGRWVSCDRRGRVKR
jgi:hypothetical protein